MGEAHAVRMVTRSEAGRAAIEEAGAECWIGTADRLQTLRGALESVTIACWLLAAAGDAAAQRQALHGDRLRFFLGQAVDTTVRGFVYEEGGGEEIVREMCARNEIPVAIVPAAAGDGRADDDAWVGRVRAAVEGLLSVPRGSLS